MSSYKPEFLVQGKWCDNAQRFATREEAEQSAQARFLVWTQPEDWRVSASDEPVSYARVDGRDVYLGVESHHVGCPALKRELNADGTVGALVRTEAVCTCKEG
ncbi:MAG: hypothetical protein JSV86_05870 [Gemmatimonadota bacterium]|nr:MAG: hypothetical protein JSV86_05870 [Gemmatimonadota bacterium]